MFDGRRIYFIGRKQMRKQGEIFSCRAWRSMVKFFCVESVNFLRKVIDMQMRKADNLVAGRQV